MQCELSSMVRFELASMAYSRWYDAIDLLKTAKGATWENSGKACPKADWFAFFADNLVWAEKNLAKAATIRAEIEKYHPLLTGEYEVKIK